MFKPTSRFAVASLLTLSLAGASSALADCVVTGTDPVPICRVSTQQNPDVKAALDSHKSFTSNSIILGASVAKK